MCAYVRLMDLSSPPRPSHAIVTYIHTRGEETAGSSMNLRHLEFGGAVSAVLKSEDRPILPVKFSNALEYSGTAELNDRLLAAFEEAMQFIDLDATANGIEEELFTKEVVMEAANRSSLLHAVYEVIAEADNYQDLGKMAERDGGFADMMAGGENENDTWCVRVRHYGDYSDEGRDAAKAKRYGAGARSMKLEQVALRALKPLLLKLGGAVSLDQPDCKIYVFDGVKGDQKVLARRVAVGPKVGLFFFSSYPVQDSA